MEAIDCNPFIVDSGNSLVLCVVVVLKSRTPSLNQSGQQAGKNNTNINPTKIMYRNATEQCKSL